MTLLGAIDSIEFVHRVIRSERGWSNQSAPGFTFTNWTAAHPPKTILVLNAVKDPRMMLPLTSLPAAQAEGAPCLPVLETWDTTKPGFTFTNWTAAHPPKTIVVLNAVKDPRLLLL